MAKKNANVNEHPITEEMLAKMQVGDPIARFGFFVNMTYQGMENDVVSFADKNGTIKKEPKWLFLKHARVAK